MKCLLPDLTAFVNDNNNYCINIIIYGKRYRDTERKNAVLHYWEINDKMGIKFQWSCLKPLEGLPTVQLPT